MGDVTNIGGGPVDTSELDEFMGEYMMVYFDEDGNITPLWTEGLTPAQLTLGVMKLINDVNVTLFWDDGSE